MPSTPASPGPQTDLAEAIRARSRLGTAEEVMPGLHLYHHAERGGRMHGVIEPSLCVIAQGSKEVWLGEERYRYDRDKYLLVSMQLPLVSQVTEASAERPYLGFRLELDPALIASVMIEAGEVAPRGGDSVLGLTVSALEPELSDAILRLVRLLDSPLECRVLAPLVKREIVFRLLVGQQGARLRQAAVLAGQAHRIARAVDRLTADFDKPLRVEDLARDLGMSVSGFHHHFKAVTAMSPLQYQKQIRLQEARRLMLSDGLDAASAGYRVGYDNPSHFSREYKRHFGQPPIRDIGQLQAVAGG